MWIAGLDLKAFNMIFAQHQYKVQPQKSPSVKGFLPPTPPPPAFVTYIVLILYWTNVIVYMSHCFSSPPHSLRHKGKSALSKKKADKDKKNKNIYRWLSVDK